MDDYRVVFSGLLKQEVVKLGASARLEGRLKEAQAAMRKLIQDLEANPNSVGELLYHTKHSGWPVFHAVRSPWSIHFILNDDRRLVILTRVAMMA